MTATLNLATEVLKFAAKVWDATPEEQKITAASDWAKFTHSIAAVLLALQPKIEAKSVAKPV